MATPNYTNMVDFTGYSQSVPSGFGSKDDKIDWAKFTMWLRGFLAGCEGKVLEPADVAKIMERLALVDPEKPFSYGDYDWMKGIQTPAANPFTPNVSPVTGTGTTWVTSNIYANADEAAINTVP